jgi:hypothetical protein
VAARVADKFVSTLEDVQPAMVKTRIAAKEQRRVIVIKGVCSAKNGQGWNCGTQKTLASRQSQQKCFPTIHWKAG